MSAPSPGKESGWTSTGRHKLSHSGRASVEGLSECGCRHRLLQAGPDMEKAVHLISGQKMCSRAGLPWPVAAQLRLSELRPTWDPQSWWGWQLTRGWSGMECYIMYSLMVHSLNSELHE